MITQKNLIHHEFIGLNVNVCGEKNKSLNLCGVVIDETKNTFKIESEGQEKLIPKNGSIFTFEIPSGEKVEVIGDILSIRPEDRIKKRFKKI